MQRFFDHIDMLSIKLTVITLWSGIFANINIGYISIVAGWITMLAGVTTIGYNVIRIIKELKNKENDKGNAGTS